MQDDIRTILWGNVSKIMQVKYGKDNLLKMSNDTGLAINTFTRLKDGHTYVNLGTVEQIARGMGLEAWALLLPSFDPNDPPAVVLKASEKAENDQIRAAIQALKK